jgi:hypothetical protein
MFKSSSWKVRSFYCSAIVYSLRSLGGSSPRKTVIKDTVKMLGITENEMKVKIPSGESVVRKNIDWCRLVLKHFGIINCNSDRGIWELTSHGERAIISHNEYETMILEYMEKNKDST